jgi:O-acetyl-ADP-ribose deacetylase (regulator of RNase III)
VYRFPKEEAALIAVQTVDDFIRNTEPGLRVTFVCFDEENFLLLKREVDKLAED